MGANSHFIGWGCPKDRRCNVKINLKSTLFAAIAGVAGILVLLGYFIDLGVLSDLRRLLVNWAIILVAVAILVGVSNLFRVHWVRIRTRQKGRLYSLTLIISLLLTLMIVGYYGPTAQPSLFIFNYLLVPIETSLMALLVIVLIFAIVKLLRTRLSGNSILFVSVVIVVILGTISLPWVEYSALRELRNWLSQTWAGAGSRGILLGVALGTIATGLRVLMGADRPYDDG